ncbi:MAG: hypothetical protein NC253_13695 [Ruminococcus sp.]|nr:hypothetical protein [Ruminococcus sp.]MCM1382843.1 hypothetical protein [Muribaculaceae bacterium]MCM1480522.1 hypothetical protein [Muribaculaceae bacterium]
MKVKQILAVAAAALTMCCAPMNAYADRLAERDGLKYLVTDSGGESLYSGWAKRGGDYYLYKDGVMMKNRWVTSKGVRKYFLQADGKRATGKVTIQGVEYEFDEKGALLPDEWGLTCTAEDVTPTGCTLIFTQSGGNPTGNLQSSSSFKVERYQNGEWTAVEELPDGYDTVWADEADYIPKEDSRKFSVNWGTLYGELPTGKYRIGKEVLDFRGTGDFDRKMYYAYFEIK